ncbi:Protein of unknown function, partial [Gryllus bimaculatus]
ILRGNRCYGVALYPFLRDFPLGLPSPILPPGYHHLLARERERISWWRLKLLRDSKSYGVALKPFRIDLPLGPSSPVSTPAHFSRRPPMGGGGERVISRRRRRVRAHRQRCNGPRPSAPLPPPPPPPHRPYMRAIGDAAPVAQAQGAAEAEAAGAAASTLAPPPRGPQQPCPAAPEAAPTAGLFSAGGVPQVCFNFHLNFHLNNSVDE